MTPLSMKQTTPFVFSSILILKEHSMFLSLSLFSLHSLMQVKKVKQTIYLWNQSHQISIFMLKQVPLCTLVQFF